MPEVVTGKVLAIAVAEVKSVPLELVPCQYHKTPLGGEPFLERVFDPHALGEIMGVAGWFGKLTLTTAVALAALQLVPHRARK